MRELMHWYRERLPTRIFALETARPGLETRDLEAVESVRRLAHALRGSGATYGFPEISVSAQAVEESTDTQLVPRVDALVSTLRTAAERDAKATQGILIVEDDEDLARFLSSVLAEEGRAIYVAGSASLANAILEEKDVALIILDLLLPDTDGRNLLLKLREKPWTASIPVVVTTVKGGRQTKAECLALGADDFLEKPLNVDVLRAAVASHLRASADAPRESRRDPLTGMPNRAAFHEAFDRAKYVAGLAGEPLSVAILELDGLRELTARSGTAMGDQARRRAAAAISRSLRSTDFLARWSGEEFIVLFPRTDPAGVAVGLDKARAALAKELMPAPDGSSVALSFSAGVARVGESMAVEDAVAAADRCLYRAKEQGKGRTASTSDRKAPPRRKVLVAEDDELIRLVLRRLLESEGYDVETCSDGAEALEAARRGGHALIVSDVRMPRMDGFELLRRVRELPELARTPVVMLTSMGAEEDVLKGFEMGADDYVLKPFSSQELAARVRRLLR